MSHSRDKTQSHIKKLGVIGNPIKHSKSPLIHNFFINHLGIQANYSRYEIKSDSDLKNFVTQVKSEDWIGFNITIPHKQSIIPYLDELDETVELIQACNTVVNKNGKLFGYNTDAEGFFYPIRDKTINKAIILGNGGASRAVLYQLCKIGVKKLYLIARDHQKSNHFVKSLNSFFNIEIVKHNFKEVTKSMISNSLIINSTSIGMIQNDQIFEFINNVDSTNIFYDLIYNPWKTKMMNICESKKAEVINGAFMLAHQGALAFKLFFNEEVSTEKMFDLIGGDNSND